MAKKFVWYEVFDRTSNGLKNKNVNYWMDEFCEGEPELLGNYSTKENAICRLKKWAEQKGITFEDNVHEEVIFLDSHTNETIICVGIYYSYKDEQVNYTDEWAYASEAMAIERCMELDEDI